MVVYYECLAFDSEVVVLVCTMNGEGFGWNRTRGLFVVFFTLLLKVYFASFVVVLCGKL